MCVCLFAYKLKPGYDLILALNRDEHYDRKTEPAGFWTDHSEILAGRDLQGGGTWLGVTKRGSYGILTNYRDPNSHRKEAPSRGRVVQNFLTSQNSPAQYLELIKKQSEQYNGFNLLRYDSKSREIACCPPGEG